MSEEKTNEKNLRKPGRPRKTTTKASGAISIVESMLIEEAALLLQAHGERVPKPAMSKKTTAEKTPRKTSVSASAKVDTEKNTNNIITGDDGSVAKKNTPRTPRKAKSTIEDVSSKALKEISNKTAFRLGDDSGIEPAEKKVKAGRGRAKISTTHEEDINKFLGEFENSTFKYVPKEHVLDLTRAKQPEGTSHPKKKPGRPSKKQVKPPILSLDESSRLPLAERKMLAIKANEKLAIESHERKALGEGNRYALEENNSISLPVTLDDNRMVAVADVVDAVQNEVVDKVRSERSFRARSRKGHGTRQNSMNSHRVHSENKKFTDMGVADFVAGVHGTTAYVGPDSLGEYGEQAALGVMGMIDEAPVVDALLPLVVDSEHERETKNSRRSRPRRRSKDKSTKHPTAAAPTLNHEFDAPIAEGGELSLIEAEATIRKHDKKKESIAKVENVNRVLYVSSVPDEQVEVVITENGVVSEYFVEMSHQAKIRGNIYKGIINNVDTNLQAAFVNFGCGKNGFLQIDEVHPEYWLTHHTEGGKYPPIQKVLKVGQEVLVQVVKEPSGSKGAFLTTWISLAGRFIVLTPGQEQIGVSRKVEDNVERSRLRDLLVGINPGENMGVIIRTASEGASKSNIQNDLKLLQRGWKEIQNNVVTAEAPGLIYQEADLTSRAVRDYLSDDIDEVWVDSDDVYEALKDLVSVVFAKSKDVLKIHKDTRQTLWERFNILRQLEEVTKREVVLPSGGRLVFDQTEALMAIDINSGKTQGKSNFESMVFRTNMEATEAIARHLRLRDIGGQVVIDFIEMRDRGHCRDVEKAMRNAMKKDKARHDVGRLSSFGLLELVRQRTGTSAISISSEPCPHCRGTGFRRNLEWQAQGVLREIKSKLSGKNVPTSYVHHVEHEVAFYLLNKKRDRLSELENKFDIKIEIHVK